MITRCYRYAFDRAPRESNRAAGAMYRRQLAMALDRLGREAVLVYHGARVVKRLRAQKELVMCQSKETVRSVLGLASNAAQFWTAAKEKTMKESDYKIVGDNLVAYFRHGSGYSVVEYSNGQSRQLYFGTGDDVQKAFTNYEVIKAITDKQLPWKIAGDNILIFHAQGDRYSLVEYDVVQREVANPVRTWQDREPAEQAFAEAGPTSATANRATHRLVGDQIVTYYEDAGQYRVVAYDLRTDKTEMRAAVTDRGEAERMVATLAGERLFAAPNRREAVAVADVLEGTTRARIGLFRLTPQERAREQAFEKECDAIHERHFPSKGQPKKKARGAKVAVASAETVSADGYKMGR